MNAIGCRLQKSPNTAVNNLDMVPGERLYDLGDLGRGKLPSVLLCRNIVPEKSQDFLKPSYLVFRRPLQSSKYIQITGNLKHVDTWGPVIFGPGQIHFERNLNGGTQIFTLDFPDLLRNTGLKARIENRGPDSSTTQNYLCDYDMLSERSPHIGEDLVISGRDSNGNYVTEMISVDWLRKDPQDRREKILTLASKARESWAIVDEPVYNTKYELVGYVETYRPGANFGISIKSVHDLKFGAQVNSSQAQKNWQPVEPLNSERGPSLRVLNRCLCIARDARPPTGCP